METLEEVRAWFDDAETDTERLERLMRALVAWHYNASDFGSATSAVFTVEAPDVSRLCAQFPLRHDIDLTRNAPLRNRNPRKYLVVRVQDASLPSSVLCEFKYEKGITLISTDANIRKELYASAVVEINKSWVNEPKTIAERLERLVIVHIARCGPIKQDMSWGTTHLGRYVREVYFYGEMNFAPAVAEQDATDASQLHVRITIHDYSKGKKYVVELPRDPARQLDKLPRWLPKMPGPSTVQLSSYTPITEVSDDIASQLSVSLTDDHKQTLDYMSDQDKSTCAMCGTAAGGSTTLRACSACDCVAYCSVECQKKHWYQGHPIGHKAMCKRIMAIKPCILGRRGGEMMLMM